MAFLVIVLLWASAIGLTRAAYRRGRLATPWHFDLAAIGLLGLATAGFFWRVLDGQSWMPADGGDLVSFLYPTYRFAAGALRAGDWPLWNPYLYAGAPHGADIQAGFLYPPNLALFLLWPDFPYTVLQWMSMGHIWFAGAGMYLLLARGQKLFRAAALAGALAFMFSDAFLTHFGNLNLIAVAAWLPWVFWAFTSGLAHRQLKRVAVAGILLALGSLAGHIQVTLFVLLALAVYTAAWLWLGRNDGGLGRSALWSAGALAMTALLTVLLTAPVLLPAIELAGYTQRSGWTYGEATGYSLSPAQWVGWLIPNFFGRSPQLHWGPWPRVESGYLGILPLVLAGQAIAMRRGRDTWTWLTLAVVSFLGAAGVYAIVHGWLTLLPGFGQLRAPGRFVLVTDLAVAALAAGGLDALLRRLDEQVRPGLEQTWRALTAGAGLAWGLLIPGAYLAFVLLQNSETADATRAGVILIAVVHFGALLLASLGWLTAARGRWGARDTLAWTACALILIDVASLGAYEDLGGQNPARAFEHPQIASFLASQPGPFRIDTRTGIDKLWQPDTALIYGLEDVGGIDNPLMLADTERYWGALGSRSTRLYDLLNVRYVIAKKDAPLDWEKFTLAYDGAPDLNVYENRNFLPRALIVPNAQPVSTHEEAWAAIRSAGFDPLQAVVIENTVALSPDAPAGGGRGEATASPIEPGRLRVQAQTDGPALLLVSETWYPGWQVRVDGEERGAPLRADYAFLGVPLSAGVHTVEFYFAPPLWRVGWLLAGATVLALAAWSLSGILNVRRLRAQPGGRRLPRAQASHNM